MPLLATVAALTLAASPALPGATARPPAPRFCDLHAEEQKQALAAVEALPTVRERVVAASGRFLGVPYAVSPLGEGEGEDADPLVRFDAADCQTFVETVLGIARAKTADELTGVMNDIRYDGKVSFERRNHYFEAQWLPANERKGYVREVTAELGGRDVVSHEKVVTPEGWAARDDKDALKLPDDRAPIGRFTVRYLPLGKLAAHAKDIPDGTIFAIVREDVPGRMHMVTHMGFFVRDAGTLVARHAGQDLYHQVIDEELAHFVSRNAHFRKWRVLGVMLLAPLERPRSAEPARQP